MGILQFSSVLALSAHLEMASDPQDCPLTPNLRPQWQVQVVTCAFDRLAVDWRFPRPSPWLRYFAGAAGRTQEHVTQ